MIERSRHSRLMSSRRLIWLLVITLLLGTSCSTTRKSQSLDTPAERNIPQLAGELKIAPEGEVVPPPADVSPRAHASKSADDKTLVLMADIAMAQDKIQERLRKVDEQMSSFVQPVTEIKQSRLPELEKKIDHLQKQIETATAQLDARVTHIEEHFVAPVPESDSTPIPEPAAQPVAIASATKTAPPEITPAPNRQPAIAEILEKALGEPKAKAKPVVKYSPFAQELRDNVREAYMKVLSTYPKTDSALDACIGLAGMAEQDENWTEAVRCYQEALDRFPNAAAAAEVRFGLARSLETLGEFEKARKHFLTMADSYPHHQKSALALVNAADCLAKSGKNPEALKEYQAIERANPNTPAARLAMLRAGDVLSSMQNLKEAEAAYFRATNGDDENPEVLMKLAKCQAANGKFASARENLQKLLAPGKNEAVRAAARFAIASTYEEEGDFLNAAREYASGADTYPTASFSLEARIKCAQLFLSLEMPDHALAHCDQLLATLKKSPYQKRAGLEPLVLQTAVKGSRLAANNEKLQSHLKQLRREWPDSPQTQAAELEEADLLEQAGKSAEAIASLRELVRQQPNTPLAAQAILKIADIQERSKSSKRGISLYGELAALTTDTDRAAQLKLRRALLLEEAGRDDEAIAVLKQLSGDSKASQSAHGLAEYQIAMIEQKRGSLDDAIAGFEKLVERSSTLGGDQLRDVVEDARWRISKLKWLSSLQKQQQLILQPEPKSTAQPTEKRS